MKIYLIERHQGNYDDYRMTAVKAYESELEAKEFIDVCNKDIKPMLDKMEEFDKKYKIGYYAFQDKFNNDTIKFANDEDFQNWCDIKDNEYNEILETFKHEELEFADFPIVYEIKKIELVKRNYVYL